MISKIIKQDIDKIYSEFETDLKKLSGRNILITGANGFIPSYLVDVFHYFNQNNKDKFNLDLINKNPLNTSSRLSHLVDNKNVRAFSIDIGNSFEVPGKAEIIFHGASRSNPISIFENPIDTIDANVNGIRTLLEYSLKNPIENLIFFSSSEVYGDPTKEFLPTPETYFGNVDVTGKMAAYSESKRFSETLAMAFFRTHGTPVKIPRIFHTYGPGIRNDGKTITSFFIDGYNNQKIKLRDAGSAKRSYSYVSDTVRGIFQILFKGDSGEVYNVGNDQNNVSVKDLAYKVKEVVSENISIECPFQNYQTDDRIKDRMPNLSKLRSIGFSPKISLDEGLSRMNKHYQELGYI